MLPRSFKLLSLASAAFLIGALPSLAQPAPAAGAQNNTPQATEQSTRGKSKLSPEDQTALLDGRIAGMLGALKLTPDQQKLWPPVEKAIREQVTEREKHFDRKADRELDFIQRLDKMGERATQYAERAKNLSSAMKPFWATLDERQKRLLPMLMRMGGGRGGYKGGHMGSHGGDAPPPR